MATAWRCTLYLNQAQVGASESYQSKDGVPYASVISSLQRLMNARVRMAPPNVNFLGIRIAQQDLTGGVLSGVRNSLLVQPTGTGNPTTEVVDLKPQGSATSFSAGTGNESIFRNVIQTELLASDSRTTPATNKAIHYTTPIPDYIMGTEPATLVKAQMKSSEFSEAYNDFWGEFIAGNWGILANDNTTANLTTSLPSFTAGLPPASLPGQAPLLGAILGGGAYAAFVGAKFVRVMNTRPPRGVQRHLSINGIWPVFAVDNTSIPGATVVWLGSSDGITPSQVRTTPNSKMRVIQKKIVSVWLYSPIRVGIRRRGKPSLGYRGRRSTPYSLAP